MPLIFKIHINISIGIPVRKIDGFSWSVVFSLMPISLVRTFPTHWLCHNKCSVEKSRKKFLTARSYKNRVDPSCELYIRTYLCTYYLHRDLSITLDLIHIWILKKKSVFIMQKSEKIHLEVGLDYLSASIGNKGSISLEKK